MKNMNNGPRAYKLKRDKVPVIPLLSLSSGRRSRRRKGQKGRLDELRVAEDTKGTSRRHGDGGAGGKARRRGGRTSARCRGHRALVLRVDGLAACPLPLPQPPYASRPRRRPREAPGASDADDGVAGATRSGARHLVGPVIPPPAALVVTVAVLLVTPARGGAFAIGGALHAAPCPSPKAPEDLDGEETALHQLEMEGEPRRQAVDAGEHLPPSTKIHHIRGREVDADSRTADSAAPHMQPQCLGRIQLHHTRKWSQETKGTTRRPTQPDKELARVVPNMVRHGERICWRRRDRRTASPTSSPTA